MAAQARAIDAGTTLNNSGSFGVLSVPLPQWQPERDPQRALAWCVECVHHEVLGMTALLVTARGDARVDDVYERDSEVRRVARVNAPGLWEAGGVVRFAVVLVAFLVAVGVCAYFAWRTK